MPERQETDLQLPYPHRSLNASSGRELADRLGKASARCTPKPVIAVSGVRTVVVGRIGPVEMKVTWQV